MMKEFKFNWEIIYKQPEDFEKDSAQAVSVQKHIVAFQQTESDTIRWEKCYSTVIGSAYYKTFMKSNEGVEIDAADFKKHYRKTKTRITYTEFNIPSGEKNVTISLVRFRGPAFVCLAKITLLEQDDFTPDDSTIAKISNILQQALPHSHTGRITGITDYKLAVKNASYKIPFTKLLPQFAKLKICKALARFLPEDKIIPFEYKWARLRTGIILIRERYGDLVNPITNNKIDPMYIQETWPAFSTDELMYALPTMDSNTYKHRADELALELIRKISNGTVSESDFKNKMVSYHGRRIKYVEEFEKVREAKRALANMGKYEEAML